MKNLIALVMLLCSPALSYSFSLSRVFGFGRQSLQHIGDFAPNDPRAVPTFLIIGTAKGGTTDLHHQLTHASVNSDPARADPPLRSHLKEAALLHHSELAPANFTPFAAAFRDYLARIGHACAGAAGATMRDCLARAPHYTIDASPMYGYSPSAPLLLRAFSPDSKAVVMLREPLDRAEALYHHWVTQDRMWPATSLDDLASAFFAHLRSTPGLLPTLQRLAGCATLRCQAEGWQDAAAQGLLGDHGLRLFVSGLYPYALAAWRLHFFRPGRVMVVDSHTYFRNREGVMEQVVAFLYGRSMTSSERDLARNAAPVNMKHRHNSSAAGAAAGSSAANPAWRLSPPQRAELEHFYEQHVTRGLREVLRGLRDEGAWLVGFDGEPWPWAK